MKKNRKKKTERSPEKMKTKRIIAIIMSIMVIFAAFSVGATMGTANAKQALGDVNNDGNIDVEDLLLLKKHVLKIDEFAKGSDKFDAGDIN